MTRRAVGPAVAVLLFGSFVAAMATTANPSFTLTDLGPGTANAINSAGSVVGAKPDGNGTPRAYIWTSGVPQQTDLGIADSSASGINDAGVIVGAMTSNGAQHAFRWANGSTTDLGALPGDTWSAAAGVNASGQIVGSSSGNSGTHPFLWANGSMSDLGTLGGSTSTAAAINDGGKVVGTSLLGDELTRHAFVWDSVNGMESLGDLDGNNGSEAMDVNEAGDIAGSSFTAQYTYYYWYSYWVEGPKTATLWQNGVPVALGGPYTEAFAVNDATADHGVQVVGAALDYECGVYVPVLWEVDGAGQVTSRVLDESLNAEFTGYLGQALAINDGGQIAASGSSASTEPRALLLTPSGLPAVVQPLHAPTYISASAGTESVTLYWGSVCDATSYVVKRGTVNGGPYQTIASGLTQTSYTDTTAPLGATYHYVVAAVRSGTTGANSADVAAAPLPKPPTGLSGKAIAGKIKGRVDLKWTASASTGIAHYKVFRIDPNGARVLIATTGNVTSYSTSGLTRKTRYGFYVTAVHTGGQESLASSTVYVTAQ